MYLMNRVVYFLASYENYNRIWNLATDNPASDCFFYVSQNLHFYSNMSYRKAFHYVNFPPKYLLSTKEIAQQSWVCLYNISPLILQQDRRIQQKALFSVGPDWDW